MRGALLLLSCCVLSIAYDARAEVVEFDVPGLTGGTADTIRVDTVVYHGPTAAVNLIYYQIKGHLDYLGRVTCVVPPGTPVDTLDWFFDVTGYMKKPADDWWTTFPFGGHQFVRQVGPFDETQTHRPRGGVELQQLTDGDVIKVGLLFKMSGWIGVCFLIGPPAAGTVQEVTVKFDVSYQLPVETSTWGRIKSLY